MALTTHESDTIRSERPQITGAFEDHELLSRYLRLALNPGGDVPSLSVATADVNWPRLLALAHRHEVLPLLNFGLRDVSGVPAAVRRCLEAYCRTVVAQNLCLASELAGLSEIFEASHLTMVPFKGPVWTIALYGNLALRQILDLDIFIDTAQAGRVFKLLIDRGYALSSKSKARSVDQIRLDDKDVELIHSEAGIHLELHWSACEPSFDQRLSHLKLWEPVSTATLLGREMPIPSPEDIFFLMALHGSRHRWESLKWICDIAAAIQAFPDLNWDALLSNAARLSRKRLVLLPLALVQQLFGTQLPACVAEAIAQDPGVRALASKLKQRHYSGSGNSDSNNGLSGFVYRESIRIRSRENYLERLSLFVTLLLNKFKPTPNDRRYFSPHTLPEPLYWLLRPLRVLGTYGLALLMRLAGQLIAPLCRP